MTAIRKVLLLFAHPAIRRSQVNRRLLEAAGSIEGVTVHDLYECYPDFMIDVGREQALLEEHEILVLQHPLFWYSSPAIIKEWQDLVLEHGWAYGEKGHALHGKSWLQVISAGGTREAYCAEGINRCALRQFLRPFEQTAELCGMRYLAPFVTYNALKLTDQGIRRAAEDYRRILEALVQGRIDLEAAAAENHINTDLDRLLAHA